ncbi:MAG: MarR family transcriptional regulator [Candidatus Jordarchaeaceae archaeon]
MSYSEEAEKGKKLLESFRGFRERSFSVLRYILENQKGTPVSSSKIQESLSLTPSNLSHAGKILEDAELITREREGYIPNLGVLLAAILEIVLDIDKRVNKIEEKLSSK